MIFITVMPPTKIYTVTQKTMIMQKTLLAFVLILLALSTHVPLLDASPEQVVDTSGKKLLAGISYYILPATPLTRCGRYGRCRSNGGGLSLSSTDKSCPLDVVVVDGVSHGLPLTFSRLDDSSSKNKGGSGGVIRVSTDLNIMFCTDHTSCAEYSPVWKLDEFDESREKWFVTTGGSLGNPGWRTIRNWFKIEKCGDDGDYKLVYCPTVCPSSKHMCKDIGVFVDENGNRRLALSDVPFIVKFLKA